MNRRTLLIGGGAALALGGGAGVSFARMGSSDDYARAMSVLRVPLGAGADVRGFIRYATLAANGHNTQPWRFRVSDREISITPDLSRRTPAVDPDDHHLYASLGCASENLALAAASGGRIGEPRFDPAGDGAVIFNHEAGAPQASALCDAIPKRQSTRADYNGQTVSSAELAMLKRAGQASGVALALLTDRAQVDRVRDLLIAANTLQMADRAFLREFKTWMRFNPRAALDSGDGLFSGASGNPSLPSWLGRPMFDLVFKADAENAKYATQLATSAGIAVFVGAGPDPGSWFEAGRACQRFALQATALGLKISFINQPIEVASMRAELAALVGMPGRRPDIVMRFGHGPNLPMSPRRPVEAVTLP